MLAAPPKARDQIVVPAPPPAQAGVVAPAATLVFDYPTIDAIVHYVASEVCGWSDSTNDGGRQHGVPDELAALSEDEAEAVLLAELTATEKGA